MWIAFGFGSVVGFALGLCAYASADAITSWILNRGHALPEAEGKQWRAKR